jgi:hypothetical protein
MIPKASPQNTVKAGNPAQTWSAIPMSTTQKRVGPMDPLASIVQSEMETNAEDTQVSTSHGPTTRSVGALKASTTPGQPFPERSISNPILSDQSQYPPKGTAGNPETTSEADDHSQSGSATYDPAHTGISTSFPSHSTEAQSSNMRDGTELSIRTNSIGQYVVNGQTFAPSQAITLSYDDNPVTFRMIVTDSSTWIAVGDTKTVPLVEHSSSKVPFAFTRASNGNFVLDGTTLKPSQPITVGATGHKTTLQYIMRSGVPAIILDGSTTELLTRPNVTLSSHIRSAGLPVITHASAPPHGSGISSAASETASKTSSGSSQIGSRFIVWHVLVGLWVIWLS